MIKGASMKIILTGGGTGGHVTPALSVAQRLLREDPKTEILFIGRKDGKENDAVKKAGLPLFELEIYGIKRSLNLTNLKRIFKAVSAKRKAKAVIKSFSPDVVLGTGGYVCWPVLSAAKDLGIPTAIHESNTCPGLVTRVLSRRSTAVLLNYGETANHLKRNKNCMTVGNPVNEELYRTRRDDARASLGLTDKSVFILSFGGSGGADVLNKSIAALMKNVSSCMKGVYHLHATGKSYYDKELAEKERLRGCKTVPYIDNMPRYLCAADIVICRCGAMTLSELAAAGCCAVLIPSPNVTADHQRKNAALFCERGAAIMIEESELCDGKLDKTVKELILNKNLRDTLSQRISKLKTPTAAKNIVEILRTISKSTPSSACSE